MYYKNLMISYSGKKAYCVIHQLKYDSRFVSEEQIDKDLVNNFSNIKKLIVELEPGKFDDYKNNLSWDGKFYGIPANVCQEIIDHWNELQKLTPEQEAAVNYRWTEMHTRPLNLNDLKEYEYKIDKNHLIEMINYHNEIRVKEYELDPIPISYYQDLIDNFHYKE